MTVDQAEAQAKKMMDCLDNDGSGQIDYTEFLQAAINKQSLLTRENIRKAFYYFDKDGSGIIERDELSDWLSAGGIIPENIVSELIDEADIDGDGNIDLNEFEALLVSKLNLDESFSP